MYIHLGKDVSISANDVIGIFDMDTATVSKDTQAFLKKCEQSDIVTNVSPVLPKSFTLCRYDGQIQVFISAISSSTLRRRANPANLQQLHYEETGAHHTHE